jgi:hypothetical protein
MESILQVILVIVKTKLVNFVTGAEFKGMYQEIYRFGREAVKTVQAS